MYSYTMIENQLLGIFRLFIIVMIRILIINLYISLIFSVSLEIVSIKIIVYFFIIIFIVLALFTKINLKWNSYNKLINFNEIWKLNWYSLDQFVYWSMQLRVNYIQVIHNVKVLLIVNWWVIVIFIFIF